MLKIRSVVILFGVGFGCLSFKVSFFLSNIVEAERLDYALPKN